MITQILLDFDQVYKTLEKEKLQHTKLECNCSNPGLKAECRSCPGYIEVVTQIQNELYDMPHLECTYLKEIHNSYRGSREESKQHSQVVIDKALQMYLDGVPKEEICQELKIGYHSLDYYIAKRDLPRRLKRYDEEFINKAIDLYHQLKSTTAVAKQLGINRSLLIAWMNKNGVPFYEKYTDKYKQECIDLYHKLGNAAEVARQMGIPKNNVRRWLTKAGIKLSRKKLNNIDIDAA